MKLIDWLKTKILDLLEPKCPKCGCRARFEIYGETRNGWRCAKCDYRETDKL